jgi:hypothetical protein
VRLRAEGHRNVLLVVGDGVAAWNWSDDGGDEPRLETDAAARTLVIWGRRPESRGRVRTHMPASSLAGTQALLAGY